MQTMTSGEDLYAHLRHYNPYSMNVVRTVKEFYGRSTDSALAAFGNLSLNSNNYQLYIRLIPTGETDYAAINNWLDADSNHRLLPFPIDSVTLYPHLFTEEVLQNYIDSPTVFYTTIPLSYSLPDMELEILDTLYVPDENEGNLDFILNAYTANFGAQYLSELSSEFPDVYNVVTSIYSACDVIGSGYLEGGSATMGGNVLDPWEPPVFTPITPTDPDLPGLGNRVAVRSGRITFTDNSLNVNEGVRKLSLTFIRYSLISIFAHVTHTDNQGFYSTNIVNYGAGIMLSSFNNNEVKVKGVVFNGSGFQLSANIFLSVLSNPMSAMHVHPLGWTTNANTINLNFNHGTREAHWSLIYNGIQEANNYTIAQGMRGVNNRPYLNVWGIFGHNNVGMDAAPMMGYIGSVPTGFGFLYATLGGVGSAPMVNTFNTLPDLVISQHFSNPLTTQNVRQTIYHEYGHSLHYFRVGTGYWTSNILASGVSGNNYGTDINSTHGRFFSLTEGWADYVGHTYSFMKYGNPVTASEVNVWIPFDPLNPLANVVTGNYQQLLEEVPTFANDFIPRGLFYDLTDADNVILEDFDLINGFTTNQIYQKLNPNITTIQQFRDKWENDHPNANNALLFDEYGVQ